jgi:hypothetical protein
MLAYDLISGAFFTTRRKILVLTLKISLEDVSGGLAVDASR